VQNQTIAIGTAPMRAKKPPSFLWATRLGLAMLMIIILLVCVILGAATRRYTTLEFWLNPAARFWVLWVALPAMIFRELPRMGWDPTAIWLFAGGFVVFIGATFWVRFIGQKRGWTRTEMAALILTSGLGNTSFLGLPVMRITLGEQGIGPALIFDQSSFIALALGGTAIAAWGSGKRLAPSVMMKRIFLFPPTVAVIITLLLIPTGWLDAPAEVFRLVALTLSPVALFAVGLQIKNFQVSRWDHLFVGLSWKLLLAPLTIAGMALAAGMDPMWTQVALLQAGMPPMVTAAIVAESEGLEAELASRMVVFGLLASVLTLTTIWLVAS